MRNYNNIPSVSYTIDGKVIYDSNGSVIHIGDTVRFWSFNNFTYKFIAEMTLKRSSIDRFFNYLSLSTDCEVVYAGADKIQKLYLIEI